MLCGRSCRLGFLALCGSLLFVSPPAGRCQGGPRLDALKEAARAVLERTRTPGAAIGVVLGDRLVLAEGVGSANVETGAAVTPDTLFQIGSLTKLFTATAVLTAAERGLVGLDTPVGGRVSGLRPCLAALTLRQLLSHTAGLIDEPDEYGPHDEAALSAYPRAWTDEYCLLPPGRAFSYSNSGFALAGLALQEAAGKPYAELMAELVFRPLGMSRTTFRPTVAMTFPLAVGHRVREGRVEVVRPMADDARLWPAGEMFSTARDLGRFAIAFLNQGRLDGEAVLPRAVPEQLQERRAEVPGLASHYGFGLALDAYRGLARAGHDGTMPGFGAVLATIPSRRAAAFVLANRDGAVLTELADRALDALLFEGVPAPPAEAALPAPLPLAPEEAARLAGAFTNPRRWTLEIVAGGEGLLLRQFGRDLPLARVGDNRFRLQVPAGQSPRYVVFGLGADGRAEHVQFALWTFARTRGPVP